jgi:hypothetical protein
MTAGFTQEGHNGRQSQRQMHPGSGRIINDFLNISGLPPSQII